MPVLLAVAVGGALGSVARHLLGTAVRATSGAGAFPWPTLVVNLVGSLLMGVVAGWATPGTPTYAFVAVGLLGGFTTYSSFNQETLGLFEGGTPVVATLYLAATLVGCLVLGFGGLRLGRGLFP